MGLLLAGLLLTTLQLLSGLDSTGIAGSVAPCAAGREKGKRSDRPFTERWTLSVRMPGSTLPCRQHCRSVKIEAHEVDLVANTKVSEASVECGDRVVTSLAT